MVKLLASVKKALRVLEVFSHEQPELSLTEISRLLKWHKSSMFRILMTLESEGFVEKNPLSNKYRLGLRLVDLASRVLGRYGLRDHAGPYMEGLAKELGEIVHLSVLDSNEIVYLEKKGEGQPLTVATKVGGRNPAHASAMGKVLLSGLSEKELADVLAKGPLARFTPNTITEESELLRELEKIRDHGYAMDDEETFPGIRCVAAPIYDTNRVMVAAISATVPKQRMGKQRMKEIRKHVAETARLISARIAGSGLGE
jgi:DNA-binding IclR family transcriptional regulator